MNTELHLNKNIGHTVAAGGGYLCFSNTNFALMTTQNNFTQNTGIMQHLFATAANATACRIAPTTSTAGTSSKNFFSKYMLRALMALLLFSGVDAMGQGGVGVPRKSTEGSAVTNRASAPGNASVLAAPALYTQTAPAGSNGYTSQDFETSMDQYDGMLADDFTVPAGAQWKVTQVNVQGQYFNGSGPATMANIYFYANNAGKPGAIIASFLNVSTLTNAPNFNITLPSSVILQPGTYWVATQARMDYSAGGQYALAMYGSTPVGNSAMFKNPGNGFVTGCTDWNSVNACLAASVLNLGFSIIGTDTKLYVNDNTTAGDIYQLR